MKKMIFGGIAILLALAMVMVACEFAPNDAEKIPEFAKYEVDKTGELSAVTLNLNGGGPSKNVSRALSDAMAKSSYNYFEVVFFGEDSTAGTPSVARASWDFGASAAIVDVPRDSVAISYATANPADVTGASTGAAALFIGRKETMQLLAIGLLTHVDGSVGTDVLATSRTVTFTVLSLESGVWAGSIPTANTVQFTTNSLPIGPAFDALVAMTLADPLDYTFRFKGTANGAAAATNRFTAIRSFAADPKVLNRDPTFINSVNNSVVQVSATAFLSDGTDDSYVNVAAGDPLITPTTGIMPITTFTFTPAAEGITSLTFNIPVFAINNTVSTTTPKIWYMASGSAVNLLDTGTFVSAGGSILIYLGATGNQTVPIVLVNNDNNLYILAN